MSGWRTPAAAAAGVRDGKIAAATRGEAPRVVDLGPSASGDGAAAIFLFVFPLMMAGVITTIVLLRRPAWGIASRLVLVAGVGGGTALAAYLATVGLDLLPGRPMLLAYAFLITQLVSVQSIAATDGAPPRGADPEASAQVVEVI